MTSPTVKAAFDGRGSGRLNGEERGVNHRGSIGVRLFHLDAFLFSLSFAQLSFKHSFACNSIHLGYK
jgi:hypothetical protein